jgi:hypothetical protein
MIFKVGDKVFCEYWGEGVIVREKGNYSGQYPLLVVFDSTGNIRWSYSRGGIYCVGNPTSNKNITLLTNKINNDILTQIL